MAGDEQSRPGPPIGRRTVLAGAAALAAALYLGRRALLREPPSSSDASAASSRDLGNFRAIYGDPELRKRFVPFLANVFHLYPEGELDALIADCVRRDARDPAVYRQLETRLHEVTPLLADVRYALPALAKQKAEMAAQTMRLLGEGASFEGYLEIGSHGRYYDALRERLRIEGPFFTTALRLPTHSPADVIDRGALGLVGTALPWTDYAPLTGTAIAEGSLGLITVYIGLHHAALPARAPYIRSLRALLSARGRLVIRDHDVATPELRHLVGLAHDVFNVGTNEAWAVNEHERRNFYSLDFLVQMMEAEGFRSHQERLLQAGDPTRNTLLCFSRA